MHKLIVILILPACIKFHLLRLCRNQGYYGSTYDRYVSSNSEMSTISKMKETYWTTKQAVMTKLGKKQDANIVASDAELDAKLEVVFLKRIS